MRSLFLAAAFALIGATAQAQSVNAQSQNPALTAMQNADRYIGSRTQSFAVSGSGHSASATTNQTVTNQQISTTTNATHGGMVFSDTYGRAAGVSASVGGANASGSVSWTGNPAAAALSQATTQVTRSPSSSSSNSSAAR